MEARLLIKLSLIIDKMGIATDIINIEKGTNEEVGKALIALIISKIYKAENEVYELIAEYKNISIEEAKTTNVIQMFKELLQLEDVKSFLQLA